MKRAWYLIAAAWLAHAVAWCIPVIKGGTQLPKGLPGWEAFRVAFAVIWPYNHVGFDTGYTAALATSSAITTILFVLVSPLVLWHGSRSVRLAAAWAAVAAFLVNSHWCASLRTDLRAGYFLWWFSFALLAAGLFDSGRQARD